MKLMIDASCFRCAGEVDPALIGLEQRVFIGGLVELRRAAFSEGTPVRAHAPG